jgi:hypothetical protein
MKSSLYLALFGLAFTAQVAGAQTACENLKGFFTQPPKLGDWAEMRMDMKKGKEPTVSRISFVGKEQRKGQELYRLQMVSTMNGKRHIMQMLTPWDMSVLAEGQDYDTEVVMKMGDQPAMIMPIKGDQKSGLYDLRKECAKIKYVGDETVTVPAGTFKAQHFTGPDGDTWVSKDVPGWRMVKMVTKDGETMEVTAIGTGAKNEITEKPVDMKAMLGNPEMMKKMMESQKGEDKN